MKASGKLTAWKARGLYNKGLYKDWRKITESKSGLEL